MINHHFGGKRALFDAIIDQFSTEAFAGPLRVIAQPAESGADFVFKFKMFVGETFQAMAVHNLVLQIVVKERDTFLPLRDFRTGLIVFASGAQESGYLRPEVEVDMIVGFVLDRLANQIIYAATLGDDAQQNVLLDLDYRQYWLNANIDLMLNGLV